MEFAVQYDRFIELHRSMRIGARLKRLSAGLGHAEQRFLKNVWWPIFHHFENLHPEYEIRDYSEGYRYIDFAYIEPYFRIAIEIDGIGPHWREITKWQFSEHCRRQNLLVIDGWHVLRFTYDDVEERPRLCQQTIQQLLGRWQSNSAAIRDLSAAEREIIRLSIRSLQPIKPKDVSDLLHSTPKHGHKLMRELVQKRWLEPATGRVRITSYRLHPSKANVKW